MCGPVQFALTKALLGRDRHAYFTEEDVEDMEAAGKDLLKMKRGCPCPG